MFTKLKTSQVKLLAADNNLSKNIRINSPDVNLKLPKSTQMEDLLSVRMPSSIARYDTNHDRKIDLEEAITIYEDRTNTKIQRDKNGQIGPVDLRKVIIAFGSPHESLRFSSRQESLYCYQIRQDLLKTYRSRDRVLIR